MSVVTTDLQGTLPLIARGKVRDLYQLSDDKLLFVATDRISAFDVILNNGIPSKGKLLTGLSEFWFELLADVTKNHLVPGVNSHNLAKALPQSVSSNDELISQLIGRSMVVNKYKVLPLEVIVRGYITGSAWAEYKKSGTVHGIPQKAGLQESEAFETPIYTPSTKAEQGEHDENIHPDEAAKIVGPELAAKLEKLALKLYTTARDYALSKGIIIADTKFEFGTDENGDIVLLDEVLTPDSSRFWRKDTYALGKSQDSYDKQFVRDWLISNNLKAVDNVTIPDEIVEKTKAKYVEAYETLTGNKWVE
ncbi:phosphoribosylaminoimidazolesuccinocarboxamide synthase [Sugiyamaella lignohabitans]|uniref:Phosphoribosylaminoimidazole-succinocarboxamide synthase n=1 Tax=Sugiyamaella lignohabitans TaxID=796027 RepID=A0A167C219_9ASCO|nr:phosphoribosylaminoimidazolesuccinocarboxamide synthase [Sugiyamaella lignohabitans]ANB11124.1 phosphoribosylaminoimidazolesuccinocarboxamide synthase [Sugiyamaella lignohabitans]